MKREYKKVYIAGALVGVLSIASAVCTALLLGKANYLGSSTSFVRAAGFIEEFFRPHSTATLQYYLTHSIIVDWQFMLVVGIAVGSFISSKLNGTFKIEWVPPIWRERFGGSFIKRSVLAFVGGIIAMFGVRLADGCPSGHGLSGSMQLSLRSMLTMALFVAAGMVAAHFIYRRKGASK